MSNLTSNLTNASTIEQSTYSLSKGELTPQGTRSDLHQTNTLNNLLSYKELPSEAKKELVLAKDQHEKLILNYEKQLED